MRIGSLASDEPTALDKAVRRSTAINRNNANCGFTAFLIWCFAAFCPPYLKQCSAPRITLAKKQVVGNVVELAFKPILTGRLGGDLFKVVAQILLRGFE